MISRVALLLALLGSATPTSCRCDDAAGNPPAAGDSIGSRSVVLEGYCKVVPCRRFDAATSKLRASAPGSGCTVAEVGRCGQLSYVEYSDGYFGFVEYFDPAGAMVGAHQWSDISPTQDFGKVPICDRTATERLCKPRSDR